MSLVVACFAAIRAVVLAVFREAQVVFGLTEGAVFDARALALGVLANEAVEDLLRHQAIASRLEVNHSRAILCHPATECNLLRTLTAEVAYLDPFAQTVLGWLSLHWLTFAL